MREVPIIEILWHGRGGQGAFTAARLLGAACSLADGRYALAFPSFGPERRGAPMRAFTKLDRKPVGDRSAVSQADIVIYLDNTLFGEGWEAELKEGGKVLVNTQETFNDPRVVSVPSRIECRQVTPCRVSSALGTKAGTTLKTFFKLRALSFCFCPKGHSEPPLEARYRRKRPF